MAKSLKKVPRAHNRLLDALPRATVQRLLPQFDQVSMRPRNLLYE